jgi:hypothetical protein
MSMDGRIAGDAVPASRDASAGTIRLCLPYAGPRIQTMMAIYAVLLFLVPGTMLDLVGYDYSAIAGSPVTKIHPATYFLLIMSATFLLTYPAKYDLLRYYLATKLGTIYFFCAAMFAVTNIVLGGRNGFGMFFDTDLHLFLVGMLLPFVPPNQMDRLERFIHWFFAINAVLGIFELVSGISAFPLMTFSPDGMEVLEPRATAFLAHPLHAATVTCAYVVGLLAGGGRLLRANLRVPMIALQTVALLAFGGRTALLLALVILAFAVLWQVLRFTAGKSLSRTTVLVALAVVPIGIAAIATLASLGAFDSFLDRFTEDGGSARSRVLMLPLLMSFNWADFLWGASTDFARAQIYSFGLEWGVENPFLQMSVYQGVIVASLIMSGFLCMLYDTWKRLDYRAIYPIVIYMMLCNTFGSFAGRFINFAIFIVVVTTLFRRKDASPHHVS